jgi:hypothetical protein
MLVCLSWLKFHKELKKLWLYEIYFTKIVFSQALVQNVKTKLILFRGFENLKVFIEKTKTLKTLLC